MPLKYWNIEIEGIDKCGKDTVRPYLFYLDKGKYTCRSRGILSQLAYNSLFNRGLSWDFSDAVKNTVFVLLDVDEEDWKIRCELTNEPSQDEFFGYKQHSSAFHSAINELQKKYGVTNKQILKFNTSKQAPYEIAKIIMQKIASLNFFEGDN